MPPFSTTVVGPITGNPIGSFRGGFTSPGASQGGRPAVGTMGTLLGAGPRTGQTVVFGRDRRPHVVRLSSLPTGPLGMGEQIGPLPESERRSLGGFLIPEGSTLLAGFQVPNWAILAAVALGVIAFIQRR